MHHFSPASSSLITVCIVQRCLQLDGVCSVLWGGGGAIMHIVESYRIPWMAIISGVEDITINVRKDHEQNHSFQS